MRTEKEMYDLLLGFARSDERVRAVILNGSRANPNAPRDAYQDYDIVFVVNNLHTFTADHSWIDVFGARIMLQMPEAMRRPGGGGHFNWMMLLADGNRIDLTLIPTTMPDCYGDASDSILLLDKDNRCPAFPPPSDTDYITPRPTRLDYDSCCNNFWWCLQNVAKGIARDELPYAMGMYHTVVREELHDMIGWYIGIETGFSVSPGKMGKYFKRYLPDDLYRQYARTYSGPAYADLWQAVFVMCDLFHALALPVAAHLHFSYNQSDEDGMRRYLDRVKNGEATAGT